MSRRRDFEFIRELRNRAADAALAEMRIQDAVARVAHYCTISENNSSRRADYLSEDAENRVAFLFSGTSDAVRIVELTHRRLEKPPFYAEANAQGFANLPDITHMASRP